MIIAAGISLYLFMIAVMHGLLIRLWVIPRRARYHIAENSYGWGNLSNEEKQKRIEKIIKMVYTCKCYSCTDKAIPAIPLSMFWFVVPIIVLGNYLLKGVMIAGKSVSRLVSGEVWMEKIT